MIQLNLLPDVKQEYIKAQRHKRLFISVSLLVSTVAVVLLILMLVVDLAQKKHLSDLSRNINNESQTLRQKPGINTILTVQNQLESLTALHATKPSVSKLFTNYLNAITPVSIAITTLHADFVQNTVSITGTSDALSSVNQYINTLKKTTYTTDTNKTTAPAFNNVVLSSFGLNKGSQDVSQAASYTITMGYDKNIFDITQNASLTVPPITTRADVNQPSDLFRNAPIVSKPANGGGQ